MSSPATLVGSANRLPERRAFPRHRRRLLVEWAANGFSSAGFTHDVSATGMFVCSLHIPEREMVLTINLAHPDGRKIRLRGVTVRSYQVAPSLRRARRSGFCVRLVEAPEDYFVLLAGLFQLPIPDEAE
jgi:PilZ domain